MSKTKTYAYKGSKYCFVLTENGWRNQGQVPDNNRQPFIEEYKNGNDKFNVKPKGTRVAFAPFCWTDNPNVFTDSDIYSYCSGSF